MATKSQTDREFVRSVGITSDQDTCDMCPMYEIERQRRLADLIECADCISQLSAERRQNQQTIRMWRLATVTFGALMVMAALSHGVN